MDYDNKIESAAIEARRHFLNVKIDDDTPMERYNLEEEFSKTRNNRALFVPLSLVGALVFCVLLGWVVVIILDATRTVNPAVIDNFQELRLRDVLNAARQNEQTLATILRDLSALESERDAKIEQVRFETDTAIQLLSQRRIPAAQRNAQRDNLLRQQRRRTAEIQSEYASRIEELQKRKAEIEASIQAYQARLSEADRRRTLLIQSADAVSQRQTSSLEQEYAKRIQQLESQSRDSLEAERAFHEEYKRLSEERHAEEIRETILRYNPTFQEPEVLAVLEQALPDEYERSAFDPFLQQEAVWTENGFARSQDRLSQFQTLWARLRAIPYENSIPTALDQLRRLQLSGIQEMDTVVQRAAQRLREKNERIEELQGVLAERDQQIVQLNEEVAYRDRLLTVFADGLAESGFVYRILSPQSIQVRLKTGVRVEVGQQLIVRLNQETVGTLEVVRTDDGVWARVVTLARPARPVRLWDRVVPAPQPSAP